MTRFAARSSIHLPCLFRVQAFALHSHLLLLIFKLSGAILKPVLPRFVKESPG